MGFFLEDGTEISEEEANSYLSQGSELEDQRGSSVGDYLTSIGHGIGRAPYEIGAGLSGGIEALRDYGRELGLESEVLDTAVSWQQGGRDVLDASRQEDAQRFSPGAQFAGDLAGGVSRIGAEVGLMGPWMLPEILASSFGDQYSRAREEGAGVGRATGSGAISAAGTAAGVYLPTRMMRGRVGEKAGSLIGDSLRSARDFAVGALPMTYADYLAQATADGTPYTLGDVGESYVEGLPLTVATGALMGPVNRALHRPGRPVRDEVVEPTVQERLGLPLPEFYKGRTILPDGSVMEPYVMGEGVETPSFVEPRGTLIEATRVNEAADNLSYISPELSPIEQSVARMEQAQRARQEQFLQLPEPSRPRTPEEQATRETDRIETELGVNMEMPTFVDIRDPYGRKIPEQEIEAAKQATEAARVRREESSRENANQILKGDEIARMKVAEYNKRVNREVTERDRIRGKFEILPGEESKSPVVAPKSGTTDLPTSLEVKPKVDVQTVSAPAKEANVDDTATLSPLRQRIASTRPESLPVKDIFLSEDVPNMKRLAGKDGIVAGKRIPTYDPGGTPPIVVWERLNGRLEVITGRHRLDAAQRTKGIDTIEAHRMREADGFTVEMARMADREYNIRDGYGDPQDYVEYFRDAKQRGEDVRDLLRENNARIAYDIANSGSLDLIAAHQNYRIPSSERAAIIARSAPVDRSLPQSTLLVNETVQAELLKSKVASELLPAVAERITPLVTEALKNVDAMDTGQMAMFANDLSRGTKAAEAAVRSIERAKDIVRDNTRVSRALDRTKGVGEEDVVGGANVSLASKRAAVANEIQIMLSDPKTFPGLTNFVATNKGASFQQIAKAAQTEKQRLGFRGEITEVAEPAVEQSSLDLRETRAFRDRERGAVVNPFVPLYNFMDRAYQGMKDRKGEGIRKLPQDEAFLEGRVGKMLLPDKFVSEYRDLVLEPRNFAKISVEGAEAYNLGDGRISLQSKNYSEFHQSISPYFKLKANEIAIVDRQLIAEREAAKKAIKSGAPIPRVSEEQLKQAGWSEERIAGRRAVRETMNLALDKLRESFLADLWRVDPAKRANYQKDVEAYINMLRDTNYVPASRYGRGYDITVRSKTPEVVEKIIVGQEPGQTSWLPEDAKAKATEVAKDLKAQNGGGEAFIRDLKNGSYEVILKDRKLLYKRFFDSAADTSRSKRELEQQFPDAEVDASEKAYMKMEAYDEIPFSVVGTKGKFNPETWGDNAQKRPVTGFPRHLIEAALVPGYDTNLAKPIGDYMLALSKYHARKALAKPMHDLLQGIDPAKKPFVRARIKQYFERIDSTVSTQNAIMNFTNFMTLGFNIPTGIGNLSQQLTTTLPYMLKYVGPGQAIRTWGKAEALAWNFILRGEKALAKDPALARALTEEAQRGKLEAQAASDLMSMNRGAPSLNQSLLQKATSPREIMEASMIFQKGTERLNRTQAFIGFWEIGKSKGLQGERLRRFAEEAVDETQFVNTAANAPKIAESQLARIALQYKTSYVGKMIRFLRDNGVGSGNARVALASIAMQGALAGAFYMPGMATVLKIWEALGGDPKDEIREAIADPTASTGVMYGIPAMLGYSLNGAGIGELIGSWDRGVGQALLNAFGGPASSVATNFGKGVELMRQGQTWMALEQMAPRFLKNPSRSLRSMFDEEGAVRDAKLQTLFTPDRYDQAAMMFGFTPQAQNEAYERRNTAYRLQNLKRNMLPDLNLRYAVALKNGDYEELDRIDEELLQYNINNDDNAQISQRTVQQYLNDDPMSKIPKALRGAYLEKTGRMKD